MLLQEIGTMYHVATLMTNCDTCLHGDQTGNFSVFSTYNYHMVPLTQQYTNNQIPTNNNLNLTIMNKYANTEKSQIHSPTAYALTSDEDLMEDNAFIKTKEHSWQAVTKKRKHGEESTQKQYQIQISDSVNRRKL